MLLETARSNFETSRDFSMKVMQRLSREGKLPLNEPLSEKEHIPKARRKRIKLGIRNQITIIVCFAAVFSLLVLATSTGIYFNRTMQYLQKSLLGVIAKLKATQVLQALRTLSNQVYWQRLMAVYSDLLTAIRTGNASQGLLEQAQSTLNQSVAGIEFYGEARIYDIDLNLILSSQKDAIVPKNVSSLLYPLNVTLPSPSRLFNKTYGAFFTGPVSAMIPKNILGTIIQQEAVFMGVTYPIFSNITAEDSQQYLFGFMSVIVNATSVLSACVDDALFGVNSTYNFGVLSLTGNNTAAVFPKQTSLDGELQSMIAQYKFLNGSNSIAKATINWGESRTVAAGYAPVPSLGNLDWHFVVLQSYGEFIHPANQLRNICIAVGIGTCVLSCAVAFFLAIVFLKPIIKLTIAADEITKHQKSLPTDADDMVLSHFSFGGFSRRHAHTHTLLLAGAIDVGREKPELASLDTSISEANCRAPSHISYVSGLYSSGLHLTGKISPVSSFFKNELTELTDAFNIMVEELQQQYQYLEERVKLRTKELEASKIEAESANEAKTVFIANISHELRTPLNGILGMTAIAMEENDKTRIQESLRLIYRSGELLLHILTELLTYSKNTLNRSKLEPTNFQILEVVYQVKSIFDKLALDQGVNFKILIQPSALRKIILLGDANRIIQIVMNLVSNALKFTPIDGSVSVIFKLRGEYDEDASAEANHSIVAIKQDEKTLQIIQADQVSNDSDATKNDNHAKINEDIVASHAVDDIDNEESSSTLATNAGDDDGEARILSKSQSSTPQSAEMISALAEHRSVKQNNAHRVTLDCEIDSEPKRESISNSDHGQALASKEYEQRETQVPKTWVILIEVVDTGSGIAPKLQKKVFEPFIQGDQTLSRSYGGTGLGLSICRQLATMMKGTLTLESQVSVGSKFVFTVPLKQVGEFVVSPEEMEEFCNDEFNPESRVSRKVAFGSTLFLTPIRITDALKGEEKPSEYFSSHTESRNSCVTPRRPPLRPSFDTQVDQEDEKQHDLSRLDRELEESTPAQAHRILVAEDNKVNQVVIKRMLTLQGWSNITMACDGEEAINYHKASITNNEPFDIIFMDIQMPKIDGISATQKIRTIDPHVSIVALTAFADESNVRECINSGMTGFLSKPIKKSNLLKIVSELCPQLLGKENLD